MSLTNDPYHPQHEHNCGECAKCCRGEAQTSPDPLATTSRDLQRSPTREWTMEQTPHDARRLPPADRPIMLRRRCATSRTQEEDLDRLPGF